ncbi:MAG: geranylgeranyl reductase family protein [Gemmatimonadales bacterium]
MYDLVVIGGGPAGTTAARRAGLAGRSVLLIDAAAFPRRKPCGGAVSEQAMSYLDFPIPQDFQEADVYGVRVHFRGRTIPGRLASRIATTVSRERFDAFLLAKAREAGAEVREGERVTDVRQDRESVAVVTGVREVDARYCVIATGAKSPLATVVRPPLPKNEYAIAVEMDVPSPADEIQRFADGLIDIHFEVVRRGYGWVFPHATWFNVGIAGLASRLARAPSVLDRFAAALPPVVSARLDRATNRVGAPIPVGGVRRALAKNRVLLAGDAAGFVDAFSGEGIAYAIQSGALAASAVVHGRSVARRYTRACATEIVRPLRYSLHFARLLYHFPGVVLRVFVSHPEVLERFLAVPARQTTYRQFLRWFLPRVPWLLATSAG